MPASPRNVAEIKGMEKPGHVYVLELEGGHWYVGWSADIQTRIASHFLGAGAKWTQQFKPLAVHSVRPGDTLLETLTTIAMMCEKGWEKVRGGSYCHVEMPMKPRCIAKAMHYAAYRKDESTKDTEADLQG